MRLWTVQPKYLDCKGLVALWREGLLAKKVLEGRTRGYRNHPQLKIFKNQKDPVAAINTYLLYVWREADKRGYNFNKEKIGNRLTKKKIKLNKDEVFKEFKQLKAKLRKRDYKRYRKLIKRNTIQLNPLFF